ncbi:hypothetical protein PsalMR5_04451 (plasmid) [Piscirickettsia salmonis]|uniref:DUF6880 family protein n=1 Tax=Piscirickettsia salmonis TaxID=1238 RepID=UPI001E2E5EEA|nr:DUF6880 family protein [Piscirickettsia salmonis]QGP57057.1 hypothetical protein PsalSR1_04546 [Piscirickettsia salmonis]QGP61857.1 hypothetical protein PsalBI1_04499 [Piscirickettsia salmonis]QGP66526.1 hypothetical protein PsalMR5_04451 [Piscirickettsia salmonis]
MPALNRELWTKKLERISQEKLFDCILSYAEEEKQFKKKLDLLLVSLDPKKLAKKLKTEVTALKRTKKFLDWHEASLFAQQIDSLLTTIEKDLLEAAPQEAADLLQAFIETDRYTFERADDSNGDIGSSYREMVELWGKAWDCVEKVDPIKLAETVFTVYLNNSYGVRDKVISNFKHALVPEGINHLEQLIKSRLEKENSLSDSFSLTHALREIADLRDDVDGYIDLVRQGQTELHPNKVLEVSQRLIKAWRAKEAIDYLKSCNSPSHYQCKINALLIEAYELEGLTKKAQEIRWQNFERLVNASSFQKYIKHCSANEVVDAKKKAIEYAKTQSLKLTFHFLMEMGEVALVATWVRENINDLESVHYSFLRTLSNQLAQQGYPLEGVVCRRILNKFAQNSIYLSSQQATRYFGKLPLRVVMRFVFFRSKLRGIRPLAIDGVLVKAQSKYYKYAVNDLKQAMKFSEDIQEWGSILSQADYHEKLKETHKRKLSLWQLVQEADLKI